MIYSEVLGHKISKLGFGLMRLPSFPDGTVDEDAAAECIDFAIKNGVNYFDTAFPYHNGKSELYAASILGKYDRESYFLADKFPGHQYAETYYPQEIFEEQLKKCNTSYFDFYLLHNVNEDSINVYLDERWGIIPYFLEQKKLGRIKHLGFSCHSTPETLKCFLEATNGTMEFCQIQYNYMDEELQNAKEKYKILSEFGVPIWVMEPVRGGRLAKENKDLKALRPDESEASFAFRWLLEKPQVKVILSGMSNLEQVKDNIKTFSEDKPLNDEELSVLNKIAKDAANEIPCTGCRYCMPHCTKGLDIPFLLSLCNEAKYEGGLVLSMTIENMPEDKRPSACINCGECMKICPQGIEIPKFLKELDTVYENLPKWSKLCEERAAAAAALKEG